MDDISAYRLDLAVIRETADRIINDFAAFQIKIVFSGEESTAYQELMTQLIPEIVKLLRSDKAKLMQILYKVDISERILQSSSEKNETVPLPEIISRLLIEREMQKVVTRRYYKSME